MAPSGSEVDVHWRTGSVRMGLVPDSSLWLELKEQSIHFDKSLSDILTTFLGRVCGGGEPLPTAV